MKQLSILLFFVTIGLVSFGQVYQEMPQYGYRANRMAFDSTLQIPTFCGVPTLRSVVKANKNGAIGFDSCNNKLYQYNPKTLTWSEISGGTSIDTTSLSNRINKKIDSLKRSNDSVYAWINGTRFFQFKDSVGGGGGNFWKTSGTTILGGADTIVSDNGILTFRGQDEDMGKFEIASNEIKLITQDFINYGIKFVGLNSTIDTSTYKPLGIDNAGKIAPLTSWVSGGNGGIDSLKRSADSVYARKNGNFIFQFKDSVGTNPAPVGYYGSFIDTTTQSAIVINTAYPIRLGVTELSNGVSIASNSRIRIANAGIYNLQFSLQLEKTGGSGNMTADIWLRKNGTNVPNSTGKVVLTGSANASPLVVSWNYLINSNSNDYYELIWSTSNLNVEIVKNPATSTYPLIPSVIATITQQSGIMSGTGISPLDTASMLNPYARTNVVNASLATKLNISDTASMLSPYAKINLVATKLNASDTSSLQPKSIPANSFIANNTSATANGTAQFFKDTSGTYTASPVWNGTAPTSGTLSYRWIRIGKMVTINISLVYANAGSSNTQITIPLPSDAPTPTKPSGLTSASNLLYPCYGGVNATNQSSLSNSAFRGFLRNNSSNNGFEFFVNHGTTTPINAFLTCTYFTD
jgi:hypothetical protein